MTLLKEIECFFQVLKALGELRQKPDFTEDEDIQRLAGACSDRLTRARENFQQQEETNKRALQSWKDRAERTLAEKAMTWSEEIEWFSHLLEALKELRQKPDFTEGTEIKRLAGACSSRLAIARENNCKNPQNTNPIEQPVAPSVPHRDSPIKQWEKAVNATLEASFQTPDEVKDFSHLLRTLQLLKKQPDFVANDAVNTCELHCIQRLERAICQRHPHLPIENVKAMIAPLCGQIITA